MYETVTDLEPAMQADQTVSTSIADTARYEKAQDARTERAAEAGNEFKAIIRLSKAGDSTTDKGKSREFPEPERN